LKKRRECRKLNLLGGNRSTEGKNRGAHSNPSRASENCSKESVRWLLAK